MRRARLACMVLLIFLLWLAAGGGVSGQAPTPIRELNIALWPEYDDPRLLVIMTGTLDAPAGTLRLPLPPTAEPNAVAYSTDEGKLLVAEWTVEQDAQRTVLVAKLPTARFQVEYYVDAITHNDETVVQVRLPVPDAPVRMATLQVQQPANTRGLRGIPPLTESYTGFANLTYFKRALGSLRPGDTVAQEVRYVRLAPGLSARLHESGTPAAQPPPEERALWPCGRAFCCAGHRRTAVRMAPIAE